MFCRTRLQDVCPFYICAHDKDQLVATVLAGFKMKVESGVDIFVYNEVH